MSLSVSSGGELVMPAYLLVAGVTLTVAGKLSGVQNLTVVDGGVLDVSGDLAVVHNVTVGDGADVTLRATGGTGLSEVGGAAGSYELSSLLIDGRTVVCATRSAEVSLMAGVNVSTKLSSWYWT